MRTYLKKLNLPTYLGLMVAIGLSTVSCTSLNSNYYDTDGIYNTGRIKAPVTHNETAYYQEYFEERQNNSFDTFTDIDSYSSYENGNYPGWGENYLRTNIYINSGFGNPYWGWNNYYPGYGWNMGFGYNNYFGWNYGFGFGGGFGWGYPYYGYGWGYPYYGNSYRNISRTSNTRTISNNYRNTSAGPTRSSRVAIENSRTNANRISNVTNTRGEISNIRSSNIRNSSTRTDAVRQNSRQTNYNTPSRNTTINSSPSRSSMPSTRTGGSSMGGGRSSSGGRR